MKITYYGHSFIELKNEKYSVLIDPFITGNPSCNCTLKDIKSDYIILTHGHGDHFGDTLELARRDGSVVIATFELAEYVAKHNVKVHQMNIGGSFNFPFGKVKLTIAHHSSSTPDGTFAGDPAGVIVTMDGKTVYHSGDTGLFYDMKLIGEMQKIDYAFLCIGDNFTMGIDDAVKATEFINPKTVIPFHYDTFDIIKSDINDFKRKVESIGKKCLIMKPCDTIEA